MKKIFENLGVAILGYLKSKKALAFYAGLVLVIGNHTLEALGLGLVLGPDAETKLVALVGTYLLGQGVADHGKEANKVHAEAKAEEFKRMNPPGPSKPPSQP